MSKPNPACDGYNPNCAAGVCRVLPTSPVIRFVRKGVIEPGTLRLCRACHRRQLEFRTVVNRRLTDTCKFPVPEWECCTDE